MEAKALKPRFCTPPGKQKRAAGRAENKRSPGTPPLRPLAQPLAGLRCRVPGVVSGPIRGALPPRTTLEVTASDIQFLGKAGDGDGAESNEDRASNQADRQRAASALGSQGTTKRSRSKQDSLPGTEGYDKETLPIDDDDIPF